MKAIRQELDNFNQILDRKFTKAQLDVYTKNLKTTNPKTLQRVLMDLYNHNGTNHKPSIAEIQMTIERRHQRQHEERKQTERKDQRTKEQILLDAEREDTRETIKQCRRLLQLKLDGIINLDELKQKLMVVTEWNGT